MRVFGQTSLLVYWVHVELVYGLLFKRFANRLTMVEATVAFLLMTAAMLGLGLCASSTGGGGGRPWQGLRRAAGQG